MAAAEVAAYCTSSDYAGLAEFCENFELDLWHTEDLAASVGIYKVHLAAYLLRADLDRARFLWKRLPDEVKADPELQAMWVVGKAMWQQNHAEVHAKSSAFAWSDPFVAGHAESRPPGGAAARRPGRSRALGPCPLGCGGAGMCWGVGVVRFPGPSGSNAGPANPAPPSSSTAHGCACRRPRRWHRS